MRSGVSPIVRQDGGVKEIAMNHIVRIMPLMVAVGLGGCSGPVNQEAYQFRDGETERPLAGHRATISTGPRVYSWLDPRHYVEDARKCIAREAITDDNGIAVFEWKYHEREIRLDDQWYAYHPIDWEPMRGDHKTNDANIAPPQVRRVVSYKQLESRNTADASWQLTTIRYVLKPFSTFEIAGTDVKGITLDELPRAVWEHQRKYPGARYEVYAQVKCVPAQSDQIIKAIRATGVALKHYWAPVSTVDDQVPPGKYGPGFVDILR